MTTDIPSTTLALQKLTLDSKPETAHACEQAGAADQQVRYGNWRPPSRVDAKLREPLPTPASIRAAHLDPKTGMITSFATLDEVAKTAEWHGLPPGGFPYAKRCRNCDIDNLACHYRNRRACINCSLIRVGCAGGVLDDAQQSAEEHSSDSPYEPQVWRRRALLEDLQDVMGKWDERMTATGGTYTWPPAKTILKDAFRMHQRFMSPTHSF
ncbi:unnamed protein product [Peniophora sp. CBMAI 1063]|nr:unnamed protein product [Peniophora sp. CBMAI 1063]